MRQAANQIRPRSVAVLFVLSVFVLGVFSAEPRCTVRAAEVHMKDGRVLDGGVVMLKSVVETPSKAEGAAEGRAGS
ncbi:MAG: hypothetical protein R3C10_16700 [Pirellulales bacterium]